MSTDTLVQGEEHLNTYTIVDGKLTLEAMFDNVIIEEDKFRHGYECKTCDGVGHTGVPCKVCNGSKTRPSLKEGEGLIPCRSCESVTNTGTLLPSGYETCQPCKGKGGSLIIPEQSVRRPSTGIVKSAGHTASHLKVGDRVLYSNHSGHAINFKHKAILRIMHEKEVLCKLHGGLRLADELE